MRQKFMRFMQGRYGLDSLSQFLSVTALVIVVIAAFFRDSRLVTNVLYVLALLFMAAAYFRMLSRNHVRRSRENQKFLKLTSGIRRLFSREKYRVSQRKNYRIFKCPGCKQRVRIPKGKGRIEIRCPKCQTKFIKKT